MSEEQKVLTKEIAEEIVDGSPDIDTSQFTVIEPEAASMLAEATFLTSELGGLNFEGVIDLNVPLASALAVAGREQRISLRGVRSITAPVAACLAPCQASLDLSGLTAISDDVAAALGASDEFQSFGHHGALQLDGLNELSDSAALALNRQKGLLSLKGLKSLSEVAASALINRAWPIVLDITILGESPAQVELKARVQEPSKFVEIGSTDPYGEIFGATALKIHWELTSEVREAGFDADWARASVMYDFASGKAWKFDIFPDLIDKGVAVPQLYGEIYITAPDEEKIWSSQEELTLSLERDTVVDIIKKVHAKARELLALKDSKFFNS